MPSYAHAQDDMQRRASEEFSPTPNPEQMNRKRDYSSMSGAGEFVSPYQQQRTAPNWLPQDQQHARSSTSNSSPYSAPLPPRDLNYSPNLMAPQQKWMTAPDAGSAPDAITHVSQPHGEEIADWIDDKLLDRYAIIETKICTFTDVMVSSYYKFIHPTYPMLSLTKARLTARVSACPAPVRLAFWEALYAAIRSFPHAVSLKPQGLANAYKLIHTSAYESSIPRSPSTNIVYLQIMMLLVIESNNQPRELQDGEICQAPFVWMGTAVGFAYSLKLHLYKPLDKSNNDPDSDDKHARRVWWSLTMMERWHAATTTCPLQIPDSAAQMYPDDKGLLGDIAYYLARKFHLLIFYSSSG